MGLFSSIKSLFGWIDYDASTQRLNSNIQKQSRRKIEADEKAKRIASTDVDVSWYTLKPLEKQHSLEDITSYEPHEFQEITTMLFLLQKRDKEEQERIRKLYDSIERCFSSLDDFIRNEKAKKAKDLLFQIKPTIDSLKDDNLESRWHDYQDRISELELRLREIEIRRREEEKQRKKAEEDRRRLEEIKRKEAEEAARLERQRQAREYEEKLEREAEERRVEIARLKAEVTEQKEDAGKILQYLSLKFVTSFYHFTDERNLHLIRRLGGLYSWHYLKEHDLVIPNPGGDSLSRRLDKEQGLEDYVRLSFCSDHPMAYSKSKNEGFQNTYVLLRIKVDVAAFKDTLFSTANAAASAHYHGGSYEDLQQVNISATKQHYVSRSSSIFEAHQAECMVKTFIPIEYITNINNPQKMYFG